MGLELLPWCGLEAFHLHEYAEISGEEPCECRDTLPLPQSSKDLGNSHWKLEFQILALNSVFPQKGIGRSLEKCWTLGLRQEEEEMRLERVIVPRKQERAQRKVEISLPKGFHLKGLPTQIKNGKTIAEENSRRHRLMEV